MSDPCDWKRKTKPTTSKVNDLVCGLRQQLAAANIEIEQLKSKVKNPCIGCRQGDLVIVQAAKIKRLKDKLDSLIEVLDGMKTNYGQFIEMVQALKESESEQ